MTRYMITEKAGRFLAGHRSTGVGTILDLQPFAAEYELRLGTLVSADLPPIQVEATIEAASEPEELPDSATREPEPRSAAGAAAEEPVEAPVGGKRKRHR